MADYLKGSIEPTAIAGAKVITTKTGIQGIWIPLAGSGLQAMVNKTTGEQFVNKENVPRYTLPFIGFRETDEQRARKWGDFQLRESWSKQQQDAEASKPKEQRKYPPTIGICYHNGNAMQASAAVTADACADPYASAVAGYSSMAAPATPAHDDMPF
jgi:hypothetical protein